MSPAEGEALQARVTKLENAYVELAELVCANEKRISEGAAFIERVKHAIMRNPLLSMLRTVITT